MSIQIDFELESKAIEVSSYGSEQPDYTTGPVEGILTIKVHHIAPTIIELFDDMAMTLQRKRMAGLAEMVKIEAKKLGIRPSDS